MDDNILICTHKFLTQPDDDLVLFLRARKIGNLLHVKHSFSDAPDRCSRATWYRSGEVYREFQTRDYKWLPELLVYVKEMFFTFKWALSVPVRWDLYVGLDGLCSLFGNILRAFGRVRRTAYWAIDFVPEKRFNSALKNALYHRVNIHGYRHSSEMWDISPRMAPAREKFLGVKAGELRLQRVVPYCVWTDRIRKYSFAECQRTTLVFMGHLIEKQGVQNVIRAIPEIARCVPGFRFKIIGGGVYQAALQELARSVGVLEYCEFTGKIADIRELEDEVAVSCVGIAPYLKELDTWTYYADPGKIKTYLACGIPVLTTDLPWNATEIEKASCGRIITEDKDSIVRGVVELMDPAANQGFRDNALSYSLNFDCNRIFTDILGKQ